MKYNILVENTPNKFTSNKEIYDDSNGNVDEYLIYLQSKNNNRSYAAEAIKG